MAFQREIGTLNALPDEVLQQIISYIPPLETIRHTQRVSKRFNRLSNESILWRSHCQDSFNYWNPKHRIRQIMQGSAGDIAWKSLYADRKKMDIETSQALDRILESQTNRIEDFDRIRAHGYDAKDTLLRHCHTSDDAEDVLSRRYYATAVLDHLHRSEALAEWAKLVNGEDVPIERALGAFDLFVIHEHRGDLLEICDMLDEFAAKIRAEYLDLDDFTTRKKALTIAGYLRRNNLTGIDGDGAYRDLQNSYIGIALQDPRHPSLPLISVAIFCGIARRLGVDARCCGIPNHVHAMVFPDPSKTLDGRSAEERTDTGPMYLDPYRSDIEVPQQHLLTILTAWGIPPDEVPRFISDSNTATLVLRTSRNILVTVQERSRHGGPQAGRTPAIQLYANEYADMDTAYYSSLWAHFMLTPISSEDGNDQRQFIPLVLERFERLYPMDVSLITEHICDKQSPTERAELLEMLQIVRAADAKPKQINRRSSLNAPEKIKYKVGQVFSHRRYPYTGVITGWDVECGMGTDWIAHNDVDSLSRGRNQSFYHVLVEDTSIRYVAEENIEIIEPDMPDKSLMGLAGRFFKRWDKEAKVFISNIRDEYPED